MASAVIAAADEFADLRLKVSRQVAILQLDAVLERLLPALDLAWRLRMVGCASDMADALVVKPFGEIAYGPLGSTCNHGSLT